MEALGKIANGIGQPVRRKEDFRLLTGRGSFADDVHLPELVHAVVVRSPHAHAHIQSTDKAAALVSAGVLAVLTGSDYIADGLAPIPHGAGLMGPPDVAVRVRGSGPTRPAITRWRPIGSDLSASLSLSSWQRPSIRLNMRPS
jgi:CO/xanthine dehydrogenase Mo-binding subunit